MSSSIPTSKRVRPRISKLRLNLSAFGDARPSSPNQPIERQRRANHRTFFERSPEIVSYLFLHPPRLPALPFLPSPPPPKPPHHLSLYRPTTAVLYEAPSRIDESTRSQIVYIALRHRENSDPFCLNNESTFSFNRISKLGGLDAFARSMDPRSKKVLRTR